MNHRTRNEKLVANFTSFQDFHFTSYRYLYYWRLTGRAAVLCCGSITYRCAHWRGCAGLWRGGSQQSLRAEPPQINRVELTPPDSGALRHTRKLQCGRCLVPIQHLHEFNNRC